MQQIISLGSNCAVCYHLIELNLRTHAYPFDWTKLSIAHLNQVLSNQFAGFTDLVIKKYSELHPAYSQELNESTGSIILTNKLNIQFAHEITDPEKLGEFKTSLSRRVDRFLGLSNPTFVRLETANLTETQMNQYDKLVEQLDKLFANYKLIVISKLKPTNKKITWVELKSFDSNWKYPQIPWVDVFNL